MLAWDWTPVRRKKLADILIGLGHVVFASVVLQPIFEELSLVVAFFGLLVSLVLWAASLVFLDQNL